MSTAKLNLQKRLLRTMTVAVGRAERLGYCRVVDSIIALKIAVSQQVHAEVLENRPEKTSSPSPKRECSYHRVARALAKTNARKPHLA